MKEVLNRPPGSTRDVHTVVTFFATYDVTDGDVHTDDDVTGPSVRYVSGRTIEETKDTFFVVRNLVFLLKHSWNKLTSTDLEQWRSRSRR